MPQLSTLLVPCTAAAVAVVSADLLLFAPDEGAEVERTATWTESTTAVDVVLLLDGKETAEVPTVYASYERELSVESKEVFARSGDGRPLELVRRFGPITQEASADIELRLPSGTAELSIEGEGSCELEEIGVRFVWNADDGAWVKSYADDYEGREELLEGLRPTTEFIALLPEDPEIEAGDRWDVEPDSLFDLLRPGGTLPLDVETDLDALEGVLDPLLLPGVFDSLEGAREGAIEAVVKAIEDGTAVIELDVEVEVLTDFAGTGAIDIEPALPQGATAEVASAEYRTTIDGTGELVWDLAAGRMASFRFDAETEIEIDVELEVSADGQPLEVSLRESREGRIGLVVE